MQNYFILTLFSVLVSTGWLFSQEDVKSSIIGNPADDERAANIVADAAGNTYVGGVKNEKGLIVKQNAIHQTIWSKTLSFTTNPNHKTVVNFLDVIGDTVFGCGTIREGNQQWPFYFKLNAQTGTPYWSKYDLVSNGFFSCMRYANGKYFLVGSMYGTNGSIMGKVISVSSQTGNLVWETPSLHYSLPGAHVASGEAIIFLNSTELYQGKFYITGYYMPYSWNGGVGYYSRPILIGIRENGTVFMEKWLNILQNDVLGWYNGQKIHLDSDKNLVIGSYRMVSTLIDNAIVTKCDTLGNVLFSNAYRIGNAHAMVPIDALNETADSYVLFGATTNAVSGLYAMKLTKNGIVQKVVSIHKPNISYFSMGGMGLQVWPMPSGGVLGGGLTGNSRFLNGQHYFVTSEAEYSSTMNFDINQVILDEELEVVNGCSELIDIVAPFTNIPTTIDPLPVTNHPHTMTLQNGITLENVLDYNYCDNISLNLEETPGCAESVLTATHSGFTDPTFYWSTGTSGNSNTITVSTSDTIFVRILDTKCCELFDTIVPNVTQSAFAMNLPADTTLCLPTGSSFTITPVFSGATNPVTYLWSNNSVGTSLSVSTSGTYWLELSDGCVTRRDSIVVTMGALPVIGNTGNVTVCENTFPISLSPTVSAGASVLWEDSTTNSNRSVDAPGSYTISATNTCGTVNATISVAQIDLPEVSLVSVIDTCIPNGGNIILSPVFTHTTGVLWSTGSTANQLTVSASGTYTVYASNACGTDSATVAVTLRSLPVIGNTGNVAVCEGSFPVTLNPVVSAGASVVWEDSTTNISRSVSAPGTYTISATNECGTVNASISVSQTDLPTVQLVASIDTCIQSGTSITLSPVFTGTTTVLWSNGSSGNQLPVFTSGTYTVYASNACGIDSASSLVAINYFPELNIPATLDTCFEIGVGFAYTAQGSGGLYQWSSGSQTATEWISQEGMYSVTLTNQCGSVTKSMQVRRYTEVDLYFPNDSLKECSKHFAVSNLQIETNYTLEVIAPNGNVVGEYLTESGWYLVHAFNPCAETWDSIYVNLQNEQYFYLPNSFTPNNDGHNDRFEFKGENIVLRDVQIFNRWGEVVFSENGDFTGWDGTYRGEVCPDGIYAVHLFYEDCFGMPTEFSGHVNLIR